MPLGLNKKCKDQLAVALTQALPEILVEHGMFVDRRSCALAVMKADSVLPGKGVLRERLVEYIDDFPMIEFVYGALQVALSDADTYLAEDKLSKLNKISGFTDTDQLAQRLVTDFESLPWKYAHTTEIPDRIALGLAELGQKIDLSERVRLVLMDAATQEKFALTHSDPKKQNRARRGTLLGALFPVNWKVGAYCLQIEVDGFIDKYGTTTPALGAASQLKAFYGLGIALGLFSVHRTYAQDVPETVTYVHQLYGSVWEINSRQELDRESSALIVNLTMRDLGTEFAPDQLKAWRRTCLALMQRVFSSGDKGEKLLLAARWLFDSYHGRDELLAFVQTMVVLEILLGESTEKLGVGELLRNRCAYFIARTQAERAELMEAFNNIYRVRSQIVHRGKNRLSTHERGLFGQLRHICMRVINAEVELLARDS